MRFRAILLRLLLCLALVANGTSTVHASVRMTFDGGTGSMTEHQTEPPCHEAAAMPGGELVADPDSPSAPASDADCCPPGGCLCSCVSHAPTILTVHAVASTTTRRATSPMSALSSAHASPAHPHLIRPPIG
jgi:hypothetical protein